VSGAMGFSDPDMDMGEMPEGGSDVMVRRKWLATLQPRQNADCCHQCGPRKGSAGRAAYGHTYTD
jgi:hypothetical protein